MARVLIAIRVSRCRGSTAAKSSNDTVSPGHVDIQVHKSEEAGDDLTSSVVYMCKSIVNY